MTYAYETAATSPNQNARPSGVGPSLITIHHWGKDGQRFDNVVAFLCDGDREDPTSAHYVAQAGRVSCIVDPDRRAWHAGNRHGNDVSIGIECRPEATDGDYATVAELVRNLRATYGNLPLVPHSHWKATECPGRWDLARLDRLARATPPPPPTTTEETDDMGFYVYADSNKAVYFFNQARGKLRRIPAAEWSAIRAMQTGAVPPMNVDERRVSQQWLNKMLALGTY